PLSFHVFSFLLIRHPPSSPPFPYTTLFRSVSLSNRPTVRPLLFLCRNRVRKASLNWIYTTAPLQSSAIRGKRWSWRPSKRTERKDRKSTRLNSSHVEISYAVFCLKKKKR